MSDDRQRLLAEVAALNEYRRLIEKELVDLKRRKKELHKLLDEIGRERLAKEREAWIDGARSREWIL